MSPRALAGDAPDQGVPGIGIFSAEVDPGSVGEKYRQIGNGGAVAEDDRDHWTAALYELLEERLELLALPRPEAGRADEDGGGADGLDLSFELTLPGQPGLQFPLVEPGTEAAGGEAAADRLHRLLVVAVVAQENVVSSLQRLALLWIGQAYQLGSLYNASGSAWPRADANGENLENRSRNAPESGESEIGSWEGSGRREIRRLGRLRA